MGQKLCECGCGQPAPIATRTHSTKGYRYVKGQPARFIRGHVSKKNTPDEKPKGCACGCGQKTTVYRGVAREYIHGHNSEKRIINEADYTPEDRGYETPCWIWNGTIGKDGRARIVINGRKTRPYRVLYEREVGPIPEGHVIDHLCGIPACVRPSHLVATTQSEHARRHGLLRAH